MIETLTMEEKDGHGLDDKGQTEVLLALQK